MTEPEGLSSAALTAEQESELRRLRFRNQHVERTFLRDYVRRRMWQFRIYFYVGLVVQIPVTFKLWFLDDGPDPSQPAFWLRLALGVGLALAGLRLTRWAQAERWVEWFLLGYVLIIGAALELIYLDVRNGWVHVAVFLPAALLLPRLRYVQAVVVAVALLTCHVAAGLVRPDSPGTQLGESLPWTAIVAGFLLTGVYMVEHAARRDFLLVQLLHQERFASLIEDERHRIERDLHDGAQQGLVAATMWLDVLDSELPKRRTAPVRDAMDQLVTAMAGAVQDLRELTHGGIPSVLEMHGLDAALTALVSRAPQLVTLQGSSRPDLPLSVACTAYFAAAEGLTNAARHSGGHEVSVLVHHAEDTLTIEVRDNGSGYATFEAGSGLAALRK
ncbi:MAG: histidine kinase, partial [Actinomycetota bacterium]|nr:histidine kinase [Actinomycetota bacterium]